MINENELNISNKSYVNKDFASIYNELMQMAKEISYKYDPETSNESDPFIVLLKLLAFVGDKLNYNVDKNVLERFMPSATQENTMRDLTSMLGYNMKYYIAPETKVYIKYVGSEEFTSSHTSFTIPKFDTILTDSNGETQFVLIDDCVITGYNITQLKGSTVMQGYKSRFTVLNNDDESEVVLLENLDENNRLYFSEKKVAQNGVFITGGTGWSSNSTDSGYWERVDNLNIQPSNSFVYKFGYDSDRSYPYIEFPDDITSLIGSGLTIDYIVTDGLSGNISAKKLNTLKSPTEVYWDGSTEDKVTLVSSDDTSSLIITNTNGTINGADPEGVDEAYINYKKIVGTFNTLVTCRDYANAIYNLMDSDEIYNLVSNVQVADRRTDFNKATNIVTYTQYGKEYSNNVASGVTAYDLMMYPLTPIKTYTIDSFKDSFLPLSTSSRKEIENDIEDSASISHDYKYPETSDIYAIKNYYKIKAFISTTSKVNSVEGAAILANINKALVEKFNARNVDYGYEIPYDTLLSTIEGADERIKAVSLYEPELETKFMTNEVDSENGGYKEYSLFDKTNTTSYDMFLTTIAKNVLSGRVALYDYYDKFDFDFGQTGVNGYIDGSSTSTSLSIVYDDIESVTTEANITIPNLATQENGYTLLNNEVIQVVKPSLITKATYPYGINYYLYLASSGNYIPQNTEYELKSGDLCVFEYTDSSSNAQVVKIYKHDDNKPIVLKPNFDMYTTSYRKTPRTGYSKGETSLSKKIEKQTYRDAINAVVSGAVDSDGILYMFTLSTNDQVENMEINTVDMESTSYCAWIMNNTNNEITWDSNNQHMLETGEYFYHTDLGYNELYSYGSGTVLTRTGMDSYNWTNKVIDVTAIDDEGLLGHKEFFKQVVIDDNNKLNFLEQEILTLTTGDSIVSNGNSISLSNSFTDVNGKNVEYKLSDDSGWTPLTTSSYTSSKYNYRNARSLLDINCGPELSQTLVGKQSITFYTKSGSSTTSIKTMSNDSQSPIIKLERLHQLGGGTNISLVSVDLNDTSKKLYDSVCIYKNASDESYSSNSGFTSITLGDTKSSVTYSIPNPTTNAVMMVNMTTTNDAKVNVVATNCVLKTPIGASISSLSSGLNNIVISSINANATIKFTITDTSNSASLTIRTPRFVNSNILNDDVLGLTTYCDATGKSISTVRYGLLSKISSIDTNSQFYYCNDIDNTKAIEYDDLSSPYAFYDYNNVANKWTISEIEFSTDEPDISITRGSLIK